MSRRIVTVFGGSGFIGRHVVRRLAQEGAQVRVAVRDPETANYLRLMGGVGQIVPVPTDISDTASIAHALVGADQAVNLVGILFEARKQRFQSVHTDAAASIADASQTAGLRQLVHVSAIGADTKSDSLYAQTKGLGEAAVKRAFPGVTILRPSIVFGPEDGFFNLFAGISGLAPALPVFGCPAWPKLSVFSDKGLINFDFYGDGGTKFQPVYVGDVADAVMTALRSPETAGKVFELGGPTVYTSKELMVLMLQTIGRRRLLLPLPFWLLTIMGFFMEALPRPLITRDQVKLLRRDNVVARRAKKLQDLGITPTAAEAVLPTYLARFKIHRSARAEKP